MYFNAQTQRFESVFGAATPATAAPLYAYDNMSCASISPCPEATFVDVDAAFTVDYLPAESVYGDVKNPILAERFRTRMCRNHERTGDCPYFHRCMFAHGDHELRTKAMNLADGLVTEEAIKNFKKIGFEARKAAAAFAAYAWYAAQNGIPTPFTNTMTPSFPAPASQAAVSVPSSPEPSPLAAIQCSTPPLAYVPSDEDAVSTSPSTPSATPIAQLRVGGRGYRHDPYHQLPLPERSPVSSRQ
jgi:hypothetical protein